MDEALNSNFNYVEMVQRRLPLGLVVGLSLLALAIVFAFGLPAVYKSRAVILIEQQDIPQDLVRSLVTSYADQRIQVISQRVLTNANLVDIIERYDLYPEQRKANPLEIVLAQMRKDIVVAPISADVVDQRSGRATKATIAFELAFNSKFPPLAQRVANDLVSLFLNENLKQRSEATEDTLNFLATEAEKLSTTVSKLETELADFKERHAGALPELTNLNLQMMNTREQDLVAIENQIRSLEQQRVYLESELAQQQPTTDLFTDAGQRVLSPADRLKVLESEYISLNARYGSSHPDVVAMRKEIGSLRAQAGAPAVSGELGLRLQQLQSEAAVMRERYASDHPDVRRIDREIEAVEREIADAGKTPSQLNTSAVPPRPDNPVYVQLMARLDATVSDLRSLQGQRAALQAKIVDFETRLTAAPQVEREYRSLTRDYESALVKYQEVQAKRQEAELAKNLESGQKGERFTLIEPPVIPEEPDRPNRLAIALLGTALAVASSVGAGVVAETLDSRIYGRNGISRLTGVPPLAVIPKLETKATRRNKLRRQLLIGAAGIAALTLVLALIHVTIGPLDVLMFRGFRVLGL
jgi:uncharacterized protein involved in exopolysaccharide biosynthesis